MPGQKIRLLHLITRLPIGGAERMLLGVLRSLDAERFESLVCCIQDRGELADEVEALGIPVVSLGLMQGHGYDRAVVPVLKRLMTEQRIDLVHTHLYHGNLYGRLAARSVGIPAIASVHNTYTKRKWYRHLINRVLARSTFRITAGSEEVLRDIVEHDRVPSRQVVLLPNGIDLKRVETGITAAAAKLRQGFAEHDFVIGTVGRVEEQKGHVHLLEAFAQLRTMPDLAKLPLRLLIVGDGRLKAELDARAASLGIADACRLPGNIAQLADVYRGIDLFVMPSLWEGLSLAMLEAMAAGLPIVATEVGGARKVLGNDEYGLLVPSGDAQALAAAMHRLLQAPGLRQSLAAAGAERVRTNFTVTALARQFGALYLEALAARAPQAVAA